MSLGFTIGALLLVYSFALGDCRLFLGFGRRITHRIACWAGLFIGLVRTCHCLILLRLPHPKD
ncbi:hypothetical protein BVG79_00620 [Ketogulonicigenium robustum]|uniref:Uncharacterized protein n=1 Tax=Ketogulonicigenium robustum TaxID=92947 RepID=A0A1W6NXK9_9RHOB|nr:hypothetical protein BVG79_00620 [Ketogulonicigenium robustum]